MIGAVDGPRILDEGDLRGMDQKKVAMGHAEQNVLVELHIVCHIRGVHLLLQVTWRVGLPNQDCWHGVAVGRSGDCLV